VRFDALGVLDRAFGTEVEAQAALQWVIANDTNSELAAHAQELLSNHG
jgi:hypothetical protein